MMSSIFGNTVGNRISDVNSNNRECFYIQHSVVYIQIFLAQFNHLKKEERRKEKERNLTVKPRRAPPVYNWELLQLSKGTDGERGGSVVECRTPEREVGGSKPIAAVLCPSARHFTPRKYWLITQEAVAPSRHDWKIVDWDVKPQHKQTKEPM